MTRTEYGGTPGDAVFITSEDDGDIAPFPTAGALTVYDWTGTTQLTQLLDAFGDPATVAHPDARGVIRLFGPDGYTAEIIVEEPGTGYRWRIMPADLARRGGVPLAEEGQYWRADASGLPVAVDQAPGGVGSWEQVTGLPDFPAALAAGENRTAARAAIGAQESATGNVKILVTYTPPAQNSPRPAIPANAVLEWVYPLQPDNLAVGDRWKIPG